MSIENPTLAHFRHFSSLFTNLPSTSVENVLQISSFYAKQTQFTKCPNKLNLFNNNELYNFCQSDKSQKQTQSNPIQSQYKPNSNPIMAKQSQYKAKTNPNKPNFKGHISVFCCLTFSLTSYL